MTRLGLGLILASVLCASGASAGPRLAVGAHGGVVIPEDMALRAVYTWPRGSAWTPSDVGPGYTFREPLYTTPRGYRYVYVRGYQLVSTVPPYRRHTCVTDSGYGRYENCR